MTDDVTSILEREFEDRIYTVEENVVWVSGMNACSHSLARRMAKTLVANDVPTSLVYDDGAARFGGVEFRYGDAA